MTQFLSIINTILINPLYNLLMFLVFLMPSNSLGLAVIILTVAIRLALLPTTKVMTRQQALMAKLKPELDGIRDKYKENKAEQAQALMVFYKKHKVNPAGSCFPMVAQLLVLIALYYVFRIGVTSARFDLLYSFTPRPSFINPNFFGIDLAKPDFWILPIIAGLLQFYQSWQMLPKGKPSKDDSSTAIQKQMTFVLPFVSVFVARSFPAALPLYWIVSSIISIIQQAYILRQTNILTIAQADDILEAPDQEKTFEKVIEGQSVKSKTKGVEVTVRTKNK